MILFAMLVIAAAIAMIGGPRYKKVKKKPKLNIGKLLIYGISIGFATGPKGFDTKSSAAKLSSSYKNIFMDTHHDDRRYLVFSSNFSVLQNFKPLPSPSITSKIKI